MKHTDISLKRPVTVIMICAALAVLGGISAKLLPLEEFPDIEWPGFFVLIPYEGSTPAETERQVTKPAEEALATLPGIKRMHSRSRENQTEIWLEYGFNSNVKAEAVEARVKLDAIRGNLPEEVRRILVFSGSLSDEPIMTLRVSSERDLGNEYLMLNRLVKRRLERIEGVSKVELQGVEPPEILIQLDAGRIAAHQIDLSELAALLENSNFAVSAGTVTSSDRRFSLRPNGEFRSVSEVRDLVINDTGLRLSDVANITHRAKERNYGRHLDGKYAIGISVSKATGANMVEVTERVNKEVEDIGKLPQMQGIRIFDLDNKAQSVKKSLSDLVMAGLIGAFLAIIVLYLFMRQLSTTLIVTLAVPFSLLITLSVLYFTGFSLNVLTLMGLMLAIGMLVDNSVVITESIFRARQKDPNNAHEATMKGVKEVGLAVMASTLTSICVFLPIVFGEQIDIMVFLWHVGVTISVAIVSSLIIAQTVIPLLASRVKPPAPVKDGSSMQRLTKRYTGALQWTLAHPRWSTLIALLLLLSAAIPVVGGLMKIDMFPQEANRRIYMPYHIEGSYPVDRVEQAVDRIESYLFENKEELDIQSVYSYFAQSEASTVILLNDESVAKRGAREVMEQIEKEMPKIAIGNPNFKWDQQGGGDGFSIALRGDSTQQLMPLADEALRILNTIDGLDSLVSDLTTGEREIQVKVDRERAAKFGLSSAEVAQFVNIAMRGRELREFRTEDGEISMRMGFRKDDKQTIEQLGEVRLPTPDGRGVLLSTVATLKEERAAAVIRRNDRKTAVKISGSINAESSMDQIKPQVTQLMNQMSFPPGYSWGFGAGVQRNDETQSVLLINILLGIVLIYIVMAALFESLLYPLTIMISLIFSFVGVIWFLTLTGTTMTMMAMIGIMILIGVVVNNGIVLVDQINNLRGEGITRNTAVVQAAAERLRPILMTVGTTILGLAPLSIGTTQIGSDGPAYFPMARAIIGGLAFSTVTSLLLVPLTYVSLDRLKNWFRRVRTYKQTPAPSV
ncbi:MAG: efflux RND transporter permease subunit [Pseudomonadota bacterium]